MHRRLGPFQENTIVVGDSLDIMPQMPDGCVDLVITDPPYEEQYSHLWLPLGQQGQRLMKTGASLVTLCGHYQIPFVIKQLSKSLRYWWIGGMYHKGNLNRFPGKWVCVTWKPALWYVKERRRYKDYECPIDLLACDHKEKDYHKWGQPASWFRHWIERLSNEGDLIFDPCIGSGTTAVVADRLGRKFFGCDINPDYVEMALERLEEDRSRRSNAQSVGNTLE